MERKVHGEPGVLCSTESECPGNDEATPKNLGQGSEGQLDEDLKKY